MTQNYYHQYQTSLNRKKDQEFTFSFKETLENFIKSQNF